MVDAAYHYSIIREYTTCKETTIRLGRRTLQFHNTNRLISNPRWQIGLSKTGFIDEAGRCLVMQSQLAKRPVLIVLLDAQVPTPHLARLGAVEISRSEYLARLQQALALPVAF